jgi:hypothetical protein
MMIPVAALQAANHAGGACAPCQMKKNDNFGGGATGMVVCCREKTFQALPGPGKL